MATTDTKLYVALGVLVALGGALYVTNKKQREEAQSYSLNARASDLPKLEISDDDVSKINKISLHKPGKDGGAPVDVTLVKKGEEWRLEQPDALANQANVKSLLDGLKSLKVGEQIDPGKTEYAKYQVSDDLALHAVLSKDNGAVLDAYFGENGGRGQMTRLAGKDGVYAIKGYSDYLFNRDVKGWRDLTLFKFEEGDVTQVTVDNEHGSFTFDKGASDWTGKFKPAKGGGGGEIKRFDPTKVADLVRAYKMLNADNFADKSKTASDLGLDKPSATIRFTLKDGAKREAKLGASAEGSSRWVEIGGKTEFFSISSWAADWALAEEKKFQKEDTGKKDEKKDAAPAMPPGMQGMPPGMGNPHGGM
ncbi:MAG TPA: DUF4340 domain-containing protein [Polyangiaceae bacterium]|nr:DUF4340 domain-containing protein [Polyangiaceae bacterium]